MVLQLVPPQASLAAPYVDDLFALETGIGSFIFFGCTGVMGWVLLFNAPVSTTKAMVRRLGKHQAGNRLDDHPAAAGVCHRLLFDEGERHSQRSGTEAEIAVGADTRELITADPIAQVRPIQVIARQWSWEFVYPNGVRFRTTPPHRSAGQPPVAIRGRDSQLLRTGLPTEAGHRSRQPDFLQPHADETGRFRLRDAMFSGAYMSVNQSNVIVESEAYADWLKRTASIPSA